MTKKRKSRDVRDSPEPAQEPCASASSKKQKLFDYSDVIKIIVGGQGQEQKTFILPRGLATSRSAFLEAACKPCWTSTSDDGQTTIRLPEELPGHFNIYLGWLSTEQLELDLDLEPNRGSGSEPAHRTKFKQLLRLYSMGLYLQDLQFCNRLVDEWSSVKTDDGALARVPNPYICDDAATLLPPCPLRRLIALQMWSSPDGYIRDMLAGNGCSEELKNDLLMAAYEMNKKNPEHQPFSVSTFGTCHFHEHDAQRAPKCPAERKKSSSNKKLKTTRLLFRPVRPGSGSE